jgi:hypothetical protein
MSAPTAPILTFDPVSGEYKDPQASLSIPSKPEAKARTVLVTGGSLPILIAASPADQYSEWSSGARGTKAVRSRRMECCGNWIKPYQPSRSHQT